MISIQDAGSGTADIGPPVDVVLLVLVTGVPPVLPVLVIGSPLLVDVVVLDPVLPELVIGSPLLVDVVVLDPVLPPGTIPPELSPPVDVLPPPLLPLSPPLDVLLVDEVLLVEDVLEMGSPPLVDDPLVETAPLLVDDVVLAEDVLDTGSPPPLEDALVEIAPPLVDDVVPSVAPPLVPGVVPLPPPDPPPAFPPPTGAKKFPLSPVGRASKGLGSNAVLNAGATSKPTGIKPGRLSMPPPESGSTVPENGPTSEKSALSNGPPTACCAGVPGSLPPGRNGRFQSRGE